MSFAWTAEDTFNTMVYGAQQHPSTVSFLRQQFEHLPTAMTEAGHAFVQSARSAFEWFQSNEWMAKARDVLVKANSSHAAQDVIMEAFTVTEMNQFSLVNQRFMMACPEIRESWMKQRCDGWSETYQDLHPGQIGWYHYDYRRATEGMETWTAVPDTEEQDLSWTSYPFDELLPGDRHLIMVEQEVIQRNWDRARLLKALGDVDPTSKDGSKL